MRKKRSKILRNDKEDDYYCPVIMNKSFNNQTN
ncbi:hypothetical protein E3V97_21360 [Pedobacter alluvionis]|uniref:Uncharacterized protein n=1 Tax=Pedobacter alluvionis TaxID=475253 RepID=A0ABY2HM18_9SPHI|nr:hypothetical protein E3V97_21360 [Pedobacter alluvionis]